MRIILYISFFVFFLLPEPGFSQFEMVGSAVSKDSCCFKLTSDNDWEAGAIWQIEKVDLRDSFKRQVILNFGNKDEKGADGFSFILQNDRRGIHAVGGPGGEMGYAGNETEKISPSLAVEFDTYSNWEYDIQPDHIDIQKNGLQGKSGRLRSSVAASTLSNNIEDEEDHLVIIDWNPEIKELAVVFDGQERVRIQIDLINEIFHGEYLVRIGWTSSTGRWSNDQKICFLPGPGKGKVIETFLCNGSAELIPRDLEQSRNIWWDKRGGETRTIHKPGAFTVKYESPHHCGVTDTFVVKEDPVSSECEPLFFIPNAFSPNNDGINDWFQPKNLHYKEYELKVYNRHGEQVFREEGPAVYWNGKIDNRDSPMDIYLYAITAEDRFGNSRFYRGTFMLIR